MSDQPLFDLKPGDDVPEGDDFTDAPEGPVLDRPLTSDETAAVITIVSRVVGGPINADFTPDKLLFATMRGAGSGGGGPGVPSMPGSLYFSTGRRIRLVHDAGPMVSPRTLNLSQYWVTEKGAGTYNELAKNKTDDKIIEQKLRDQGALTPLDPKHPMPVDPKNPRTPRGRLLEFFDGVIRPDGTVYQKSISHISRGTAVPAPPLDQKQINALVMAAERTQQEREVLRGGIRRLNNKIPQLVGEEERLKREQRESLRTKFQQLVDEANAVMRGCYNRFFPKA
jgi:hypothetical protein